MVSGPAGELQSSNGLFDPLFNLMGLSLVTVLLKTHEEIENETDGWCSLDGAFGKLHFFLFRRPKIRNYKLFNKG